MGRESGGVLTPAPAPLGRRPGPLLAAAVLAALTAAVAVLAWPVMFGQFAGYDDEGYLLVSLRAYLAGGRLYDDVYSQYGPAYYALMGALFRVLSLAVEHDTGRLVTLSVLAVTSLLCALLTLRITGRLAAAIGVQLIAAVNLFALGNEPMHPGGLLCLLLAMIACAPLLSARRPRLASVLLGGLATLASLIKINVGGLALMAMGFAWAAALPGARVHPLRLAAAVTIVAAPFALVGTRLGDPVFLRFAIHAASGALAIAVVAPSVAPASSRLGDLRWLAVGAMLAIAIGCGPALLRGADIAGLVDGILLRPLSQPGAFKYPYRLPWYAPAVWTLALTASLAWRFVPAVRRAEARAPTDAAGWLPLVAAVRIAVGVGLCMTATGPVFQRPALNLAPLAWLAAASPRGTDDDRGVAWARWLLPSLAVLQVMHAYPVAGSQQSFAALLLVPCGGVCVADGLDQLGRWLRSRSWTATWSVGRIGPALLVAALLGAAVLGFERGQARHRAEFAEGVPLDLPGARLIRVTPEQRQAYHWIAAQVRERCEAFVTVPGMNSLYLFTEQEPPTGLNTTAWMFLLSDDEKRRIVDRMRGLRVPCAVRHRWTLAFWAQGRKIPPDPLLEYIAGDLRPLASGEGFQLLGRPPAAGAPPPREPASAQR